MILDGQRESMSFKSLDVLFSTNFDSLVTHIHFEMFHLTPAEWMELPFSR